MILNRLFVVPTDETLHYLKKLMVSSPITFDFDSFHVDIMSSSSEIESEPSIVYSASCDSLGIYYDSARTQASLILPLLSEDFNTRFDQLCANDITPYWDAPCKPYMTLVTNCPALKRHAKGWINSISDALVAADLRLQFTYEYAVTEEQSHPLNYDFLQS